MMNEQSCDIHDVTKAAADLLATGCTVGATHFYADSITQLQFGAQVSAYANEVIQAVNDGVMSAWEGVKAITYEHQELLTTVGFFVQNGLVVAAGAMQVEAGVAVTGGSGGMAAPLGGALIAHGVNNIYEGSGNMFNGSDKPSVQGPTRKMYQYIFGDEHRGNMAYYSMDLGLSGLSMLRSVRKPGSVQLLRHDPINYERYYQQIGKLALFFEGLVDSMTINSIYSEGVETD